MQLFASRYACRATPTKHTRSHRHACRTRSVRHGRGHSAQHMLCCDFLPLWRGNGNAAFMAGVVTTCAYTVLQVAALSCCSFFSSFSLL